MLDVRINLNVTESATSLEADIVEAIKKIQAIIDIFFYLSEVSEKESMPSFV